MKKSFIIGFLTSIYFGAILNKFFGVGVLDWQFWAVCLPVIIGFQLEKIYDKDGK